ncbi:MAG: polymerase sigma-70 factor, subfamily [Acidobacteriota bacterium]|jgi:RNA polymerase sigma-70 factor (ECF subfamily)|nr:polymerase sigma-70 factor, subfamily [Acidobacteriota bacterium]
MDLFSFDDDYVRRLRDGDRETAAHFYSYFRDLLYAKLRRRLRSMHAIEEVRQEVFLRTLERLDQIADGRKLGAFVNSTCNHVLMEYYRQESRAVSLDEQPEKADATDLEAGYDSAHNTARVRAVLEGMDARDAAILRALFIDDVDKDEICERFGVDREYLRVLLHRAKAKFRAAFLRRNSGRRTIYETFGRDPSLPK